MAKETLLQPVHTQLAMLEKERQILLELGNDITKVREKNDLITLFSKRIKSMYHFTHTIITLIDPEGDTYSPFLLDPVSSPIKDHPQYATLVKSRFTLQEPFIQEVIRNGSPTSFLLEDVMNIAGSPVFLKVNYERGVREILMTPLKSKEATIGFIHIYSDNTDSFTDAFKSLMRGIAPQLSAAVTNIIRNEELIHKEWVNEVLLTLSNELVTVRDRKDLLRIINISLKKLINFTHSVMTVLDKKGETYNAYLTETDSRLKDYVHYTEAIAKPNPIHDGIYDVASGTSGPVIFNLKSMNMDQAPPWLRINYNAGAREMIIKMLPDDGVMRHSLILFSDLPNSFDPTSLHILDRISSQLSVAARNIAANEEIENKERDTSFLLAFSHDIASVRTKSDLETAIIHVLDKVLNTKLAMLRVIEDDGVTMAPYAFDRSVFEKAQIDFEKMGTVKIDIHEAYTARVLESQEAIVFNVEEEIRRGNNDGYVQLWTKIGFKNTYAAPLRVGNTNLGTFWLLADEIAPRLLNGICAQVSIALANILANEKLLAYKQILEQENDQLKEQIKTIYNFSEIVGYGAEMQKVYHLMSLVAETSSTVLLLGETGTGKELIARAIHNASPRKGKLMIKVNCAALPANLIESELFGHEKGAFTGAIERRIGKFEMAHNSTLFLDEIGEMPLELQVKLLRALQERELERVGGKTTIRVDVRIIAATNRNLEEEVRAGRFRSDLYYRLNVFPIHLPPLRNRVDDITPLANFFMNRYSKNTGRKVTSIASKALQELKSYSWPGNVRELEHLIERSILLTTDHVLRDVHLPTHRNDPGPYAEAVSNETLQDIERNYIIQIMKRYSGKVSGKGGAAEFLGVPPTTLHSKFKKLGISKGDYF